MKLRHLSLLRASADLCNVVSDEQAWNLTVLYQMSYGSTKKAINVSHTNYQCEVNAGAEGDSTKYGMLQKKLFHTQKTTQTKNGTKAAALSQPLQLFFRQQDPHCKLEHCYYLEKSCFKTSLIFLPSQQDLIQKLTDVNVEEVITLRYDAI